MQEFERVVEHQGGQIERGARHDLVKMQGARPVAIPRHKGDLPRGTKHAISKELLALGFLVLTVVCLAIMFQFAV